jgi:hypothetical protein
MQGNGAVLAGLIRPVFVDVRGRGICRYAKRIFLNPALCDGPQHQPASQSPDVTLDTSQEMVLYCCQVVLAKRFFTPSISPFPFERK